MTSKRGSLGKKSMTKDECQKMAILRRKLTIGRCLARVTINDEKDSNS